MSFKRDEDLYRLVYVSRNAIQGDAACLHGEINRILEVAQTMNQQLGITGLLTFHQGFFSQVLEGQEPVIEDLFERIQMDPRHDDVVVLEIAKIDTRAFEDWSMGFVGNDPAMDLVFSDFPASVQPHFAQGDAEKIVSLMGDLARRHEVRDRAA